MWPDVGAYDNRGDFQDQKFCRTGSGQQANTTLEELAEYVKPLESRRMAHNRLQLNADEICGYIVDNGGDDCRRTFNRTFELSFYILKSM